MKRVWSSNLAILIFVFLISFSFNNVQAKQMYFAVLTNYETVPSNNSTGIGMFSMGPLTQDVGYKILLTDIFNVTAVNLQLGSKGETGSVIANLANDTDFPNDLDGLLKGFVVEGNVTSKELSNGGFDLLDVDNSNVYLNVSTEKHPEGEIRGQLHWIYPQGFLLNQ